MAREDRPAHTVEVLLVILITSRPSLSQKEKQRQNNLREVLGDTALVTGQRRHGVCRMRESQLSDSQCCSSRLCQEQVLPT